MAELIKLQLVPPPSASSQTVLKIKVARSTKVSQLVHTYLVKLKLPLAHKDGLQVFLDDEELDLAATIGEEEISSGTKLNIVTKPDKVSQTNARGRSAVVRPEQSSSSTAKGKGKATALVRQPPQPFAVSHNVQADIEFDGLDDGIDWNDPAIGQMVDDLAGSAGPSSRSLPSTSSATARPRPAPDPPPSSSTTAPTTQRSLSRPRASQRTATSAASKRPSQTALVAPVEDEYEIGFSDEALAGLDLSFLTAATAKAPPGSSACDTPTPGPPAPPNSPVKRELSPSQLAAKLVAACATASPPSPRGCSVYQDGLTSPTDRFPPSRGVSPSATPGGGRPAPFPPPVDLGKPVAPICAVTLSPVIRTVPPARATEDFFVDAVDPLRGYERVKQEDEDGRLPDERSEIGRIEGLSSHAGTSPPPSAAVRPGKQEGEDQLVDFWGTGRLVRRGEESVGPEPVVESQSDRTGLEDAMDAYEAESTGSAADVAVGIPEPSSAGPPSALSAASTPPVRHLLLLSLPPSIIHHILTFTIDSLRLTNLSVLLACKTFHTIGRPILYRTVSLRSAAGWRSFFASGSGSQVRSAASSASSRRRDDYDAVRRLDILSPAPVVPEEEGGGLAWADMVLALHEIHARRTAPPGSKRIASTRHPFLPNLETLHLALAGSSSCAPILRRSSDDEPPSTTALDMFYRPFLSSLSFTTPQVVVVLHNARHEDQIRAVFGTIKGVSKVELERPVRGIGKSAMKELAVKSEGRIVAPESEDGWAEEERTEEWRRKSVWVG